VEQTIGTQTEKIKGAEHKGVEVWGPPALLTLLAVICAVLFAWYVLTRAVRVSFLSDDWRFLENASWRTCLLPDAAWYRYSPGGLALFCLLRHVFEDGALWYHATYLAFAVLNIFLVAALAKSLSGRATAGVAAAVLFASHPFASEPLYWIAASMFYVPALTFFLAGSLLVVRSATKVPNQRSAILIVFCYIAALSFHEITSVALPIWAVLVYALRAPSEPGSKRRIASSWFVVFGVLAVCTLLFGLMKSLFTGGAFINHIGVLDRMINYARMHFLVLGIDALRTWHVLLLPALCCSLLVSILAFMLLGGRIRDYAAIVLGVQVSLAAIAAFSDIQSRYLYIPVAIASIAAGLAVSAVACRLNALLVEVGVKRFAGVLSTALVCAGLFTASVAGIWFIKTQAQSWLEATAASRAILDEATSIINTQDKDLRKVILANPVDCAPGAWCSGGYVFRNCLQLALQRRLRAGRLRPKLVVTGRIMSGEPLLTASDMRHLAMEPHTVVIDCSMSGGRACRVFK
jgi:hypothetical protein